MTPPIRFLAFVIGGWTILRLIATIVFAPQLASAALQTPASVFTAQTASHASVVTVSEVAAALGQGAVLNERAELVAMHAHIANDARPLRRQTITIRGLPTSIAAHHLTHTAFEVPGLPAPRFILPSGLASAMRLLPQARSDLFAPSPIPASAVRVPLSPERSVARLSGSTWFLARGGGEAALASGSGLLGGSQAGARVLYRVSDSAAAPLSLSARMSSPLRRSGTEAAIGVEWQPAAGVPLRILAERRQRLSGTGRSAFALLGHGGVSALPIAAGFSLDAYAQAGVVGARRRDLFADAGLSLVRPLGGGAFAAGLGAWGGVQPGAARIDVGPRLTTVIGNADAPVRVSLDWRFRVAGGAAPGSGPSLTIGAEF